MVIDNQVIRASSPKRFIEMLQKQLVRENPSALPSYGVDGEYGSETRDWVTRFQERKGLQVDGDAGPETLGRLRSDIVQRPGTDGKGVEILQEDLLFFYIQQSSVDGSYGPGTTQGVRDFQFLNNLVVDGSAGPNTLKKMDELITHLYTQRGDSGSLVIRIQNQLNEQDTVSISINVDGNFGPATEEAVKTYQQANDLADDGIAGPRTMYLLTAENIALLTPEQNMEELEQFGFKFTDSSDDNYEKFKELFREHPEVIKVLGNETFSNIYTTELDVDTGVDADNESVVVFAEVEGKPNLGVGGHFFKNSERLSAFSVSDIFGNLPDDEVKHTVYHLSDNGVRIEETETTNVELESEQLNAQQVFANTLNESSAMNIPVALESCGGLIATNMNDDIISIQGWERLLRITCGITVSISGGALGAAIAAKFSLATGPFALVTLIGIVLTTVTSDYFCGWLGEQVA